MIDAHHNGLISLERLVELVAVEPARVFGLDAKGSLTPGSDADIALLDLDRSWTITNDSVLSKIDWTPYHGRTVRGAVARTLVRGTDVWVDGEVVGTPGHGKHVVPSKEA